jgi:hypothetical protein
MKVYQVVMVEGVDEYKATPLLNEVYFRQDTAIKRATELTLKAAKRAETSLLDKNPYFTVKPVFIK